MCGQKAILQPFKNAKQEAEKSSNSSLTSLVKNTAAPGSLFPSLRSIHLNGPAPVKSAVGQPSVLVSNMQRASKIVIKSTGWLGHCLLSKASLRFGTEPSHRRSEDQVACNRSRAFWLVREAVNRSGIAGFRRTLTCGNGEGVHSRASAWVRVGPAVKDGQLH